MIIAETDISIPLDAGRAAFVKDLLSNLLPKAFPKIGALVWFNEPGWEELMDPKYPLTLQAFKDNIANPYYKGR